MWKHICVGSLLAPAAGVFGHHSSALDSSLSASLLLTSCFGEGERKPSGSRAWIPSQSSRIRGQPPFEGVRLVARAATEPRHWSWKGSLSD